MDGYNARMSAASQSLDVGVRAPSQFASTHWSMVLAARDRASPQAREALAGLCRTYWYPLYAFIRRQGNSADQAQDLTQEFFARLLEKDFLHAVDPQKGKFRSFLLMACKHFLSNQRDQDRALKRGGDRVFVPLDWELAETRYRGESSDALPPDKLFERRWALTLLDLVLSLLRQECLQSGKERLFENLKQFLSRSDATSSQAEAAERLGMSVGSVKVAVHRLRRRYRELLHQEIARTLDDPTQVDAEVRDLFNILAS